MTKYWLDLFTGKTWEEFLKNGANVTGFREKRRKMAQKINAGDYLICYLTGLSRLIGILEVKSKCYFDKTPIWADEAFPCRFKVRAIYALDAKTAVPIQELKDKLSMFHNMKSKNAWTGFFRGSPREFGTQDGKIIVEAIKNAKDNPVERDSDQRKYWRRPRVYESKVGPVTVPDEEKEQEPVTEVEKVTSHEEIQWLLLKLGSDLGLDVYVARNDRNREVNGKSFQDIPNLREKLPRQFDEVTNRIIELIDVLWLKDNVILSAFEVEHSTAIYSGLLRMADLVSMVPNIKIDLYIIAPDERQDKVSTEINRPTFARLNPPLRKICKFIAYSKLKKEIEQVGDNIHYMKPELIEKIAESCEHKKESYAGFQED